ncbi:hypothetical protein MRB53_040884 [Persea americana]|nr:hypothetical protein MRB53_040884 [Persea americana]
MPPMADEAIARVYETCSFMAHPDLLDGMARLCVWIDPLGSISSDTGISASRLDCDARFGTATAAKVFTGAKSLTIWCHQTVFRGADCAVLMRFRNVRNVTRARVMGDCDAEVVKWLQRLMESEDPIEQESWHGEDELWRQRLYSSICTVPNVTMELTRLRDTRELLET